MSGLHAKRYRQNADVEIVALCDVSEEIVGNYIERNLPDYAPTPAVFTDAAQMYAEARPDAVTIVTPHTMHFEHGVAAIEAGCHVFMEKPMVTESRQAHALAEVVQRSGKLLVVGYNTPCTPTFRYLRELIRTRQLGNLETVTGWQTQNWKTATAGTWRQNPSLSGGGQMYDSGAHLFNSLVWSMEQPVNDVLAFIDNVGAPVDINGTVNIRFAGGTLATITIAGNCPSNGSNMFYMFEKGRVEIDGWSGKWIKIFTSEGEVTDIPLEGETETPNDNFINAILGRSEPQTSPLNGVIQSELMDAIYESARTNQVVQVQRK
jgi:predicted dehydrogenase